MICLPIRLTGLRAVIGSWKIMLSSAPHTWRSCAGFIAVSSWPAKWTVPLLITSRRGSRPMIERASTVLPDPDSPTMPRVWPRSTDRETPSTARTVPRPVRNEVCRSSTTSSGSPGSPTSVNSRVLVAPLELDLAGGHNRPSRMSNRWRSRSPIRLIDSSSRNMASTGQIMM